MRYAIAILLHFTAFLSAFAQISPPGLGDTRAAAWVAIGASQQLGPKWQSTLYVGASRESNPDNFSLFRKPAISVVDLSQLYRFNDHWSLAGCISYRKQNRYDHDPPYQSENPAVRNEARYYLRLFYRHKINRVSFTYSFRPEYRTYFNHSHHWSPVPYEYRLRLKAQATIPINASGSNQFIFGNEILSSAQPHFSGYRYTEDRMTTYFRHIFSKPSIVVDAGLMYQFLAGAGLITHVAFDIIIVDPFRKPASKN